MCTKVVDALVEIPGLSVIIVHDRYDYLIPMAQVGFTEEWNGASRDTIWEELANGDPAIYLGNIGDPDELLVDPFNLTDPELEVVIERLHNKLVG